MGFPSAESPHSIVSRRFSRRRSAEFRRLRGFLGGLKISRAYRVFWLKGGLFFAHEQWRFMVFSASRRAIFFLTLPPLSKNWSKKRNRGRWGGGPGSAICGRNPCFFCISKRRSLGWGGGPGRFGRWRNLLLIELNYGYSPHFRNR